MRILSWNCRGAGRALTVRAIKALVRTEGPKVLFLSETKINSPKVNRLKISIGFAKFLCVDNVGKAGGLALFWKHGVDLEVVFANQYVVAALIYSNPPENPWLLIATHGPPYLAKKRKFWELMEEIISGFSGHWCLLGDLNNISTKAEKKGGRSLGEGSSRSFRAFVDNVATIDLGFSGLRFTWTNKRVGRANIRERLDRGICNVDWQTFPCAGVKHLTTPNSDHNPILLNTHMEFEKGVGPFRFEAMWTKEESSEEVVASA